MAPDMTALLSAERLTKQFYKPDGSPITVLSGVSLDVGPSETVSITGESGCGKSTLLNVLSALEAPSHGQIYWMGEAIGAKSASWRARQRGLWLGFVFQSYYLVPELTVMENVLLPAKIVGQHGLKPRAKTLLERVGLQDRMDYLPANLSGGERQRAAVARALINRPKLLLADEPTGNLDETTATGVMDSLLSLSEAEQVALILVTHNPVFAKRCQTSWRLHEGSLAQSVTTS